MDQQRIQRACAVLAAGLWTLSAAVMGFALDGSPNSLAEVALWLALVAWVPTAHLVMNYTVSRSRDALCVELDEMVGRHRAQLVRAVLEVIGREDAGRDMSRIGDRR